MARLIDMKSWKAARERGDAPALICAEAETSETFHYWNGESGERYLHSVYALLDCPEFPQANYMLVRRAADGSRVVLAIGQTTSDAASLNLARLRHEGARLGANEIHLHLLAETEQERDWVETDLRAAEGTPNVAPMGSYTFALSQVC